MSELKEVIAELGSTFEDFKKSNDQRIKEIESKGAADPLLEEKINKMNEQITDLEATKAKLEKIETALARKSKVVGGDAGKLEQKALDFEKILCANRNVPLTGKFDAEALAGYKSAFMNHFRKGDIIGLDEMKALSVGSDPDGGYTVDPDTGGRIVTKVFETSPMRSVASQQTIGTDALEGMYDLDEADAGWVGETAPRPETGTPQLQKWRIPVHEIYAKPKATQKLLDDSNINIEAWLSGKVSDKFSRVENASFVNGDGVGKPRGFLTYAAGTTLPGTIEQINTGAAGAFKAAPDGGDVLIDTIYSVKQAYRAGSKWALNRSTQAAVRKLKDSNGDYLWVAGLAAGIPSMLAGYGIVEFEDMPDIAADSLSMAFGNFSAAYQIVDRAGIRVLRDPYSAKPFIEFYTVKRVGGDVIDFDAIKIVKFAV